MNKLQESLELISSESKQFVVEKPAHRLDVWLAQSAQELSRTRIKTLIEWGCVRVNGTVSKPSQKLRQGDIVHVIIPLPTEPSLPVPEDIPLEILYEDEHMIAINKEPGLVVHPGAGHASGTLVSALMHRYANKLSSIGGELRPGIVHRLDKETSGVILVARTDSAHLALSRAFASRQVEKHYLAVVSGIPMNSQGQWKWPIGRHPHNRKKMAVIQGGGRNAETLYKLLNKGADWSLLQCQILTGRTHQIRVHCSHAGHAILGDSLYGRYGGRAQRCLLHAMVIRLAHPVSGKKLEIRADPPVDFTPYLSEKTEQIESLRPI